MVATISVRFPVVPEVGVESLPLLLLARLLSVVGRAYRLLDPFC